MDQFQNPRFRIIVGAGCQKAGSSSICNFLAANGLVLPGKKELHAFRLRPVVKPLTRTQYLGLLRVTNFEQVFGEFTPNYLAHPTAIWNLYKAVPEAKILVSVRNPVDRAFSAYTHAVGAGKIRSEISFADAVNSALKGTGHGHWIPGLITEGLYAKGIERLLNL